MDGIKYIMITPAYNEEATIEKTIRSMIAQTILPVMWVVVSDGSTDCTDEIVKKYALKYEWIKFVRLPPHRNRQFAAKVHAFNSGFEKINNADYDVIGNLDADITFEDTYFEYILSKFIADKKLGVAGTPFVEDGKKYDYRFTNIEHVSGACQLFRRECFEDIGGYKPIRAGGIDWVAVTTARMKGWKTRTFEEKTCLHHRKMGTGNTTAIMTWFRQGAKDYFLGNHPVWEIFRALYQMTNKPLIIGGGLLFCGYLSAYIRQTPKPISKELIAFIQNEQRYRIRRLFIKIIH